MERKIIFFPYETLDYKAAEARLNRLGAEGWQLKKILLGRWARLERREQTPLQYCIDVNRRSDRDYISLCADAGWQWICAVRGMDIYCSAPGARPVPIQTDPGMEERRLFRQVVLRAWVQLLVSVGIVVLYWLYLLYPGGSTLSLSLFLMSDLGPLLVGILAAVWIFPLVQVVSMTSYAGRCRKRVRAGEGIPLPGSGGTALRTFLAMAPTACIVLLVVVFIAAAFRPGGSLTVWASFSGGELEHSAVLRAEDLNPDAGRDETYLFRSGGSAFARCESYAQIDGGVSGATYHCANPGTAKLLTGLLLSDLRRGALTPPGPDPLDLEPVDLGFDSAWLGRNGGQPLLLFREGSLVAWVTADGDLTAPDGLAVLRARVLGPG